MFFKHHPRMRLVEKAVPISANEAVRVDKLRGYGVLDTPPEWTFDRITQMASRLFQMPMAAVSLVDEHRQWFKARVGLEFQENPRHHSFCAHAILADEVLVVRDSLHDSRFRNNPTVTGKPGIRFYAGAPLVVGPGVRLGTLCVMDKAERKFTATDERSLAAMADIVVDELSQRNRAQAILTEREDGFHQLVEQVGDAFFLCDLDGQLVQVNQEACLALGYSVDELLTLKITALETTDSAQTWLADWKENPDGRAKSRGGRLRRKDGTAFPVEARLSFLRRNGRKLMLALVRDLTERERVENLLYAAREEVEQINRAKSELLSRISHELRTPLNAVLGFGRIVHQRTPRAEQDSTGHIVKAGERLLQLVDEILEVSRPRSRQSHLNIEAVLVAHVVQSAVEVIRPAAAQRKIVIGLCHEPARPYLMMADGQRLREVLVHLLSNAVQFSAEGSGIAVDYFPAGDQIRLCVHDRGPGIPPERLSWIFQPLEATPDDEPNLPEPGMNLVLCKHLIEALNGTIGVESVVDVGSTFWLQLPAAERYEPATDLPENGSGESSAGAIRKVLYIDDDDSNLKLIEYLVEADRRIELLTAKCGDTGLEIARTQKPDLILLDLRLPDLTGEEVLSRLRENSATRDIPVIAVSGNTAAALIDRLRLLGVHSYLIKPLDLQEVLGLFSAILKLPPSV